MKQKLPRATPGLAKKVWQSQKRPSTRTVAQAMTAAGYPINFTSVARWRRDGWRINSNDDHPLDVARGKLESILPLVTSNPVTAQETTHAGEELSDPALLRQESRKLSGLSAEVWKAAEPLLKKLVRGRTGELAVLIRRGRRQCSPASRDDGEFWFAESLTSKLPSRRPITPTACSASTHGSRPLE
jgi:hypothetical protein